MKAKRKRTAAAMIYEAKLSMTPMIDIVFLLLIFFMCATKFKVPDYRLDAALPKDQGVAPRSPSKPVEIRELHVSVEPGPAGTNGMKAVFRIGRNLVVDAADLAAVLRREHRTLESDPLAHNKTIPAVIHGHKDVDFECIMYAFNACVTARIEQINFAASSEGML